MSDLDDSVARHRKLTDQYIEVHEQIRDTMPPPAPRSRGRGVGIAIALAVLSFMLPAIFVGVTPVKQVTKGGGSYQDPVYVGASPALTYTTIPGSTPTTVPPTTDPGGGGGSTTPGINLALAVNCSGSGVTCLTANSGARNITASGSTLDCKGYQVTKVTISTNNVTVQNCKIRGAGNAGIYSQGSSNIIRHNDIAEVNEGGVGDINGITFFGGGTQLLYNNIDNLVSGPLNGSHTDCIQTWATPSKNASPNVTIKGNRCNSPAASNVNHIRQCFMAQGPQATDGGGGGSGRAENWTVADNYCKAHGNQGMKFDDIHNVTISNNEFAGSGNKAVAKGSFSTGINYMSNNRITGSYGTTVGS